MIKGRVILVIIQRLFLLLMEEAAGEEASHLIHKPSTGRARLLYRGFVSSSGQLIIENFTGIRVNADGMRIRTNGMSNAGDICIILVVGGGVIG